MIIMTLILEYVKHNGSQGARRLVCLVVVLISISCLRSHKSPAQVNAIISPKARICFNSMSTSFQSECVYCDSRLYMSTLLACTGQPTLANNVSQAQAFCIATACLEVPVLNKAEPFRAAASQLFTNYFNKLNLFRPSLLFGARNDRHNNWAAMSAASVKQDSSQNFLPPPFVRQAVDRVTTNNRVPLAIKSISGGVSKAPLESEITTTYEPSAEGDQLSDVEVSPTTALAVSTSKTPSPPSPVVSTTTEEAKSMDHPDFARMHNKIYSSLDGSKNNLKYKFTWKYPFLYNSLLNGSSQQLRQQLISTQMSHLLNTFSPRLTEKRADLQTGKNPVLLGRKKRSLLPSISFNLSKNKQKLQNNGTVTAQLNKLVNGTTSGNLAFVLNKPSTAYIWSNPLTKVFTKNSPNKSFQWQFGKGQTVAAAAAPAAGATAGQLANPQASRPATSALATSGQSQPTARPTNTLNAAALAAQPPRAVSQPTTQVMSLGQQQQQQQQQYNPTSASLMPTASAQPDASDVTNGAPVGSYVVLADGRNGGRLVRQRLI